MSSELAETQFAAASQQTRAAIEQRLQDLLTEQSPGPETIREAVKQVISRFGNDAGHVFNLGHGIHPSVNPDHLAILIDAVHEFGYEIRE